MTIFFNLDLYKVSSLSVIEVSGKMTITKRQKCDCKLHKIMA
jgi:hypothetical protein